jgi:4-amino-4-deoxy-L-arabinose transferase-like glycosyltransferase
MKARALTSLQKRSDISLVIGLVFIGLLLRLPSLRLGLWRDEAYTYFDALPVNLGEVLQRITYTEFNPPAFFLVIHQWMQWFGAGEISFKIPSLICGLLLIPATYILGQVVSSRSTGAVAAAITTFAPTSIYYSQEARPYTLAALLCCLTVIAYYKALPGKSHIGYLVGFIVCATLLLYVHYAGFLVVGSLAIITLCLWWYDVENMRLIRLTIAFGIISLLFTMWLQNFFIQFHTGTPYDVQHVWWKRLLVFLNNVFFYSYNPLQRTSLFYRFLQRALAGLESGLSLLVLGTGARQLFAKFRQPAPCRSIVLHPSVAIVGLCFVLYVALVSALSRRGRYMFPIVPLAWVLYGSGLLALWQYVKTHWTVQQNYVARRIALVLVIVLLALLNSPYALWLARGDKSGIRSLAADIEEKSPEKTFYLVSPDYLASTFGYYFARHLVQFHGFARWEHPEIWTARGYAELWNSPTLVSETIQHIQDETQQGYQNLAFVYENAKDSGQMKYSRGQELLSRLQQTYPLLEQKDYPGKIEFITLYVFSLTPQN